MNIKDMPLKVLLEAINLGGIQCVTKDKVIFYTMDTFDFGSKCLKEGTAIKVKDSEAIEEICSRFKELEDKNKELQLILDFPY